MKEISLETMDGYQFQQFVANLFKQLGFISVKAGPPTADGGIDISMEQKTDIGSVRYTVECKHHPERSIGRPVVQKLHSAVIHTPILDKGIIVTSGHFSSQAIKYAEEVGIELIDLEKLNELSTKVGVSLHTKPSLMIENCFPISEKSKIVGKLFRLLQSDLVGFKRGNVRVEEIGLKLLSSYMVDYSIDATFRTSVGMIHSIHEASSIFLHGDSGYPINPIITKLLLPLRYKTSELNEENIKGVKLLEKGDFVQSYKEIKAHAQKALSRTYTKTVSYYGANNRRYTKTCVPRNKDIILADVKRVYLPVWSLVFSISKNKYVIEGTETPNLLGVFPAGLVTLPRSFNVKRYPDECMICEKDMKNEKYVCYECGIITCDKDSSKCKVCEKVVCEGHTVSKRKFLVLSDKYCPQCAKSEGIVV